MSDSLPEDYGQGEAGPDNGADSTAVESNDSSEESVNPYWTSALENIPKEFHSQLTPTFKEWDNNYAKDKEELAKYKPYSEFVTRGVPVEDIDQSLELARIYQQQPRDLFNYLAQQYNFTLEEKAAQEEEEEVLDLSQEGFNIEKNPQFQQMRQELSMFQQQQQQQAQQRIETEMRAQVDNEVAQVKNDFPMLDIADVAAMATGMANSTGGMPNLLEAAKHMSRYLPQERASDSAPPTLSGNRGIPSNKPNYGAMTSEERSKLVADMVEAQNRA